MRQEGVIILGSAVTNSNGSAGDFFEAITTASYPTDAANRAYAQLGPGANARRPLKIWHILRKLRCCPWLAGNLAKAIHVLQAREIAG